jgi:predicted TIM-barrel fold metal-dependent hydrolase
VLRTQRNGAVCYASDYCHWDCAFPDSVRILAEREDLDAAMKRALFAGNAARLYGLPVPPEAP